MRVSRLQPRRFQVNKEVASAITRGHPWIYRGKLSSAVEVFSSGQWLQLVDGANEILGYGLYETSGIIGIRIFKRGKTPPSLDWFRSQLEKAFKKREPLRNYTNGYRALNGENDSFPGIVLDIFNETAVLQTYTPSVDRLGRFLAAACRQPAHYRQLVWKTPSRRRGEPGTKELPPRALRGKPQRVVKFKEGKATFSVDVLEGQKTGTFLDLRGLRKWVMAQPLREKTVLNLFCYTGMLGLCAEIAGAAKIVQVDASQGALDFAQQHHTLDPKKHFMLKADIFSWLEKSDRKEKSHHLVIVDPPSMVSEMKQVPTALNAYHKLFALAFERVAPRGYFVVCCCTSRITRDQFSILADKVTRGRAKLVANLQPEDDHPVSFPEGDYLKILIYQRLG